MMNMTVCSGGHGLRAVNGSVRAMGGLRGVLLSLCLMAVSTAQAGIGTWTQEGPPAAQVNALHVANGALWAGTGNGLFRSGDQGANWVFASSVLANRQINAIGAAADSGGLIYVGTNSGVFKSDDGGTTWVAINTGLTSTWVYDLAVDPSDGNVVYVGTGRGVFKTTDGSTWSAASNGLPVSGSYPVRVGALAVDPDAPSTLYAAASANGVYKSTDGGANWTAANNGLTTTTNVKQLLFGQSSPRRLFAVGTGIAYTTDGGANWSVSSGVDSQINRLAVDPSAPETLYTTSAYNGMEKSVDGGNSFSTLVYGNRLGYGLSLAVTEQAVYVGSFGFGVWKSADHGTTWSAASEGLNQAANVQTLTSTGDGLLMGVYGGGLFRRGLDGNVTHLFLGDTYSSTTLTLAVESSTLAPERLWIATEGGLFASSDHGSSWSDSAPYAAMLAVAPSNPQVIYLAEHSNSVLRSDDGGATWGVSGSGLVAGKLVKGMAVDPVNPDIAYLALYGGGLLKTTDGGVSWVATGYDPSGYVLAVAVDPTTPDTLYIGTSSSRGFKSVDGGANWTQMTTLPTGVYSLLVSPRDANTLYAGGLSAIYRSIDAGASWQSLHTTGRVVRDLAAATTTAGGFTLHAALEHGGVVSYTVDTFPDAIAFATQTGLAPGAIVVSEEVTINGIEEEVPVTITGGEYAINGGEFTSAAGTVVVGDRVVVRVTAGDYDASITVVLTVGGGGGTFTAITRAAPDGDGDGDGDGGSGGGGGALLWLFAPLAALGLRRRY